LGSSDEAALRSEHTTLLSKILFQLERINARPQYETLVEGVPVPDPHRSKVVGTVDLHEYYAQKALHGWEIDHVGIPEKGRVYPRSPTGWTVRVFMHRVKDVQYPENFRVSGGEPQDRGAEARTATTETRTLPPVVVDPSDAERQDEGPDADAPLVLEYVGVKEAAEQSNVPSSKIRAVCKDGTLPSSKVPIKGSEIGFAYRVRMADVMQWKADHYSNTGRRKDS
jgi:hypothetical protein